MYKLLDLEKVNFKQSKTYSASNLYGWLKSFALLEIYNKFQKNILVISENIQESEDNYQNLKEILQKRNESVPLYIIPDWEILPYDNFSPHQDIISQRIKSLYNLSMGNKGIYFAAITTLQQKLPPVSHIQKHSLFLNVNEDLNLDRLKLNLVKGGYYSTIKVTQHGEFCFRGSIVDIFPIGQKHPIRIELFDNTVENIKNFNVDNQRSFNILDSVEILPAREYSFDDENVTLFRQNWRDMFGSKVGTEFYQGVANRENIQGLDNFVPLFFSELDDIFAYASLEKTLVVKTGYLKTTMSDYWEQLESRYYDSKEVLLQPALSPEMFYLKGDEIFKKIKDYETFNLYDDSVNKSITIPSIEKYVLPENFKHKFEHFIQSVYEFNKVVIFAESHGRKKALEDILKANNQPINILESFEEAIVSKEKIIIMESYFQSALVINNDLYIPENLIYGNKVVIRKTRSQKNKDNYNPDERILSTFELEVGDPVVHLNYGVGRYQGLCEINLGGANTEFVQVGYANNDKIYVPVTNLHVLKKYIGSSHELAPLQKLGSDSWEKAKNKAIGDIKDIASDLLELQAKRASQVGMPFTLNEGEYRKFIEGFPFEETKDQLKVEQELINDLLSPTPTDRVICGDVGFGKTEIAMRAAFIAVSSGFQVAILAPTTLLASQHFENFRDRFAEFPYKVSLLSRFVTGKKQQEVKKQIKSGEVSIVVGTHQILTGKVEFANLGLLVIDEEHRFGVQHKEHIKRLKANLDILTLTATPIPRTLNMALSGIRELSIIATPPNKRLSVKTFVRDYEKRLIKESINRELRRGGQIYFLHNDIDTMENMAFELRMMVPEIDLRIAHGQMPERELEGVMADFYHRKFNLLLCTTIIETGIDVPTANTMIINNAQNFGLAQLHQLRGRVGRSHHQAYALMLVPSVKFLSGDSKKRLEAIQKFEQLGSGYALASQDLEIRGAGQLLGEQQSGDMKEIGVTLYAEFLDQAVKRLKSGEKITSDIELLSDIIIDLNIPAFIPDKYMPDINSRITYYRRIMDAQDHKAIEYILAEIKDCYGAFDVPLLNYAKIAKLRVDARQFDVTEIKQDQNNLNIKFKKDPKMVDPQKLIHLIQNQPKIYRLKNNNAIQITIGNSDNEPFTSLDSFFKKII